MAKMFEIKKQPIPTPEQAYSKLLGDSTENQIVDLNISLIDEVKNQPHKIHEDKVDRIAESMKIVGQLDPVIVVSQEDRYLLLAGRHRMRAAQKLGLKTVKAVIKQEKDRDRQRLMLLATNNDRNNDYSPSELAFSYLEQSELLKKLGTRNTASAVAQENNTNRKTVHKYIQLTKLDKMLLNRVDKGEITVGGGYELSFLSEEEQKKIGFSLFNFADEIHIDKSTARKIRERPEDVDKILNEETDEPKTGKRITATVLTASETKPTPPKKTVDDKLSKELQTVIAQQLVINCYSICKYIVSQFATPEDTIEYISQRYCKTSKSINKTIEKCPCTDYDGKTCKLNFQNKKLVVQISKIGKFSLTLSDVDCILRRYLRRYVDISNLVMMLKEGEENGY